MAERECRVSPGGAWRLRRCSMTSARRDGRSSPSTETIAIGHSAGGHLALWLAAEGAVNVAVALGGSLRPRCGRAGGSRGTTPCKSCSEAGLLRCRRCISHLRPGGAISHWVHRSISTRCRRRPCADRACSSSTRERPGWPATTTAALSELYTAGILSQSIPVRLSGPPFWRRSPGPPRQPGRSYRVSDSVTIPFDPTSAEQRDNPFPVLGSRDASSPSSTHRRSTCGS